MLRPQFCSTVRARRPGAPASAGRRRPAPGACEAIPCAPGAARGRVAPSNARRLRGDPCAPGATCGHWPVRSATAMGDPLRTGRGARAAGRTRCARHAQWQLFASLRRSSRANAANSKESSRISCNRFRFCTVSATGDAQNRKKLTPGAARTRSAHAFHLLARTAPARLRARCKAGARPDRAALGKRCACGAAESRCSSSRKGCCRTSSRSWEGNTSWHRHR